MTLSVDKMTKDKFNADFDVSLSEEISRHGKKLSFQAGEVIVKSEKFIKVIPLLMKGLVKISRVDAAGNELFLYYIESGASCAVSFGADAVLVNTAIAVSSNPVQMAVAFKMAVEAGRMAFEAKLASPVAHAIASSPLTSFLDE